MKGRLADARGAGAPSLRQARLGGVEDRLVVGFVEGGRATRVGMVDDLGMMMTAVVRLRRREFTRRPGGRLIPADSGLGVVTHTYVSVAPVHKRPADGDRDGDPLGEVVQPGRVGLANDARVVDVDPDSRLGE